MRIVLALIAIVLLVSPAYSQILQDSTKEDEAAKAKEKRRQSQEIERQYKDSVRAAGGSKESSATFDPWGGLRETEPPKPAPSSRTKNGK
jgi:hypothetical protein